MSMEVPFKFSMARLSVVLAIAIPAAAFSANAEEQVTPSDFFCKPTMLTDPVSFAADAADKSCAQTPKNAVTCQETVQCALVFGEDRQKIIADYRAVTGKNIPFDHLPVGYITQEIDFLDRHDKKRTPTQYYTTYLTCEGRAGSAGKDATCPGPNKCRADLRYKPERAQLDQDAAIAPPNPLGPAIAPDQSTSGTTSPPGSTAPQ